MPRESKKKTPKKKTKEKSTKESETPKMDEDEINRLMQNAFDQANAKFEERLTALREEINKKHQEEMIDLQDQFAQSMVWPSLWLVSYRRAQAIVAHSHGWNLLEEFAK